eukprot:jgi/Botrbrau1/22156/Bobra.0206s0079.1
MKRSRALSGKDAADRRLVTHRNMVKLHLLVRETLADSSGSEEDGHNSPDKAYQHALGDRTAWQTLPLEGQSFQQRGPVTAKFKQSVNVAQGYCTPSSLYRGRVKTSCTTTRELRGHPILNDSPAAGERTPDLSSVPDTPKGDLPFGSEQKQVQDRGSQHRSSLLRTALHAAAASALGSAGFDGAQLRGSRGVPTEDGCMETPVRSQMVIPGDAPRAPASVGEGISFVRETDESSQATTPEVVPDSPPENANCSNDHDPLPGAREALNLGAGAHSHKSIFWEHADMTARHQEIPSSVHLASMGLAEEGPGHLPWDPGEEDRHVQTNAPPVQCSSALQSFKQQEPHRACPTAGMEFRRSNAGLANGDAPLVAARTREGGAQRFTDFAPPGILPLSGLDAARGQPSDSAPAGAMRLRGRGAWRGRPSDSAPAGTRPFGEGEEDDAVSPFRPRAGSAGVSTSFSLHRSAAPPSKPVFGREPLDIYEEQPALQDMPCVRPHAKSASWGTSLKWLAGHGPPGIHPQEGGQTWGSVPARPAGQAPIGVPPNRGGTLCGPRQARPSDSAPPGMVTGGQAAEASLKPHGPHVHPRRSVSASAAVPSCQGQKAKHGRTQCAEAGGHPAAPWVSAQVEELGFRKRPRDAADSPPSCLRSPQCLVEEAGPGMRAGSDQSEKAASGKRPKATDQSCQNDKVQQLDLGKRAISGTDDAPSSPGCGLSVGAHPTKRQKLDPAPLREAHARQGNGGALQEPYRTRKPGMRDRGTSGPGGEPVQAKSACGVLGLSDRWVSEAATGEPRPSRTARHGLVLDLGEGSTGEGSLEETLRHAGVQGGDRLCTLPREGQGSDWGAFGGAVGTTAFENAASQGGLFRLGKRAGLVLDLGSLGEGSLEDALTETGKGDRPRSCLSGGVGQKQVGFSEGRLKGTLGSGGEGSLRGALLEADETGQPRTGGKDGVACEQGRFLEGNGECPPSKAGQEPCLEVGKAEAPVQDLGSIAGGSLEGPQRDTRSGKRTDKLPGSGDPVGHGSGGYGDLVPESSNHQNHGWIPGIPPQGHGNQGPRDYDNQGPERTADRLPLGSDGQQSVPLGHARGGVDNQGLRGSAGRVPHGLAGRIGGGPRDGAPVGHSNSEPCGRGGRTGLRDGRDGGVRQRGSQTSEHAGLRGDDAIDVCCQQKPVGSDGGNVGAPAGTGILACLHNSGPDAVTPATTDRRERSGADLEPCDGSSGGKGQLSGLISPLNDDVLAALVAAELSHERRATKHASLPQPEPCAFTLTESDLPPKFDLHPDRNDTQAALSRPMPCIFTFEDPDLPPKVDGTAGVALALPATSHTAPPLDAAQDHELGTQEAAKEAATWGCQGGTDHGPDGGLTVLQHTSAAAGPVQNDGHAIPVAPRDEAEQVHPGERTGFKAVAPKQAPAGFDQGSPCGKSALPAHGVQQEQSAPGAGPRDGPLQPLSALSALTARRATSAAHPVDWRRGVEGSPATAIPQGPGAHVPPFPASRGRLPDDAPAGWPDGLSTVPAQLRPRSDDVAKLNVLSRPQGEADTGRVMVEGGRVRQHALEFKGACADAIHGLEGPGEAGDGLDGDAEAPQPVSESVPTPETEENADGQMDIKPEHRKLEAYLPPKVAKIPQDAGNSRHLYHWQAEALLQPGVLKGRNLVYAAPTGAGKSAVAEILMMRRILTTNRPALLVFPFVALCRERAAEIQKLLEPLDKEVCAMWGREQSVISERTGAIVCTFERANAFINRKMEEEALSSLSCIIVDELHMVVDEGRGFLLELLLTKLRYGTAPIEGADTPAAWAEGVQIVGMSATMPNASAAATWLGACLYETSFRPVPLVKYLKVGAHLLDATGAIVRELDLGPQPEDVDDSHLGVLARETVSEGHAVLVFCATRRNCEIAAKHLASFLGTLEERRQLQATEASQSYREQVLTDLHKLPEPDPTLLQCIPHGVAFHHAGLHPEERKLVESAFRSGAVSVLTATSTVAAGVNLPARRVIFREGYKVNSKTPLSASDFLQMAGRAGRAGLDTLGEAILMAPKDVSSEKGYQHS